MYVLADSQRCVSLDNTKQKKLTASCHSYIAVALSRCWRHRGNRCFLCAQNRDKINELPSRQRHIIRVTELKSWKRKKVRARKSSLLAVVRNGTLMILKKCGMRTLISSGRQNCSVTVAMPIFLLYWFISINYTARHDICRWVSIKYQYHKSDGTLVCGFNLNNVVI